MKTLSSREVVERYMGAMPGDLETLAVLRHPEFVQEFPQSGEVIRGHENWQAANQRYADVKTDPREVTGTEDHWILAPGLASFTPTRIIGLGDTFTVEAVATYPGGATYHVIAILELRDGRVLRGRTYFAAPFAAPEWRAPWVEAATEAKGGDGQKAKTELDEFLTATIARQVEAEEAIHRGDVEPRMKMWSHEDPVTLFGAWGPNKSGWDDVSRTFRWVASRLSNVTDYRLELVAAGASGDLAYTVGYEHSTGSVDGGSAQPNKLRVTHVYRRENEEWKIVHRHGDHLPVDQSPPAAGAAEGAPTAAGSPRT